MNPFAIELGIVRTGRRFGIREAAREIGISPATLRRIEAGHTPSVPVLWRVCLWADFRTNWALRKLHDGAVAPGETLPKVMP